MGMKILLSASKALSKEQIKYSVIQKCNFAIYFKTKRFYNFLYGRQFMLLMDQTNHDCYEATENTIWLHYAILLLVFLITL